MLKSWGMPKPFHQAVDEHHHQVLRARKEVSNDSKITSQACAKTVANADFNSLEKIFIRDLKPFQTAIGKYLEGTIVTPPFLRSALAILLVDDNGDYVLLAMYNMVTSGPMRWEIAEKKFPVGMKIKISQPFYKIFADGNPGIRVDSPAEVYREIPNSHLTVHEVRSRGKELMEAGEYFEALELYLEGVKATKIEALLNNRSQAEIKLEQYEEALLDAAAVLMFSHNAKANQRYTTAAQKLGFSKDNKSTIFSIWKHLLQHQRKNECLLVVGTKERGNEAFKLGNYEEAKKNYSSALKDSEACVLLNNIAVVCLKLDLFHTAISAASACLQMSTQVQVRSKAHYSMAKALTLLGENELSKISFSTEAPSPNCSKPETWDFVKTDAIEHAYIDGRGRGLIAKRNIVSKELLLVDHQIAIEGENFNQSRQVTVSFHRSGSVVNKTYSDLVIKILNLVKHDGLLGKKIQCLEFKRKPDQKKLPLVDLEWMAYRKFSHDVPPFLPQTPEVVGCDGTNLTEHFIDKVVRINAFGDSTSSSNSKSMALKLRISLVNHDDNPNCVVIGFKDAFALETKRKIIKGEKLTISYGNTENWGF